MSFTSYKVDNDKKFSKAIDKASKKVADLRLPLALISKDFYRSEKAIFQLGGPGQYEDLAQSTIDAKERDGQPIYPILMGIGRGRGRLAESVTNPRSPDAINQIINKRTLLIGTEVEYGVYHQSDKPRSKIPLRKFLFIGPESRFANNDQKGRLSRWTNILSAYVVKKTGEEI
jgi:phage gpG-like protein